MATAQETGNLGPPRANKLSSGQWAPAHQLPPLHQDHSTSTTPRTSTLSNHVVNYHITFLLPRSAFLFSSIIPPPSHTPPPPFPPTTAVVAVRGFFLSPWIVATLPGKFLCLFVCFFHIRRPLLSPSINLLR
ncbi:predicted protein [Histoplasma capsulatum G186AR]|uniref:Uncharacterized protein n=1 Tax=Ajellomyces capsulatus (strain G186AR / H82 / ATCC MYA-2454 / RMSCC 2432) TaxID=447093 RepID=C0NC41_AJECG|nr:uncharacterized protein HCBG_00687 [Histoplasma capsulatum G186AR]EEH11232.1 predicted protein [Histoplasma capsulatum G186AR]